MKLSFHKPKATAVRAKRGFYTWARRQRLNMENYVFLARTHTDQFLITPQVIMNYLTARERRTLRAAHIGPNPTVAQVVKAVWPISAYAGMDAIHRRTDGRYKT